MPQCKYYDICGRDGGEDTEADLCILHSKIPDKSEQAFAAAFDTHRKERGDNFSFFVFPGETNFGGVTFSKRANFFKATFSEGACFVGATFNEGAEFGEVIFTK